MTGGVAVFNDGDVAATPPKHKQMRRSVLQSVGNSPLHADSPNTKRQKSRLLETRKSILAAPGQQGTLAAAAPSKNEQGLSELYTSCIKMSSENKINQKNSWGLGLIDHISDVLGVDHGEMTNFQLASCTLETSVKIYGYRVDSVHAEAYKVLGGLNRSGTKGDGNADSDGEASDGDDSALRTKKRAKVSRKTIEKNPNALATKNFDLAFDVDPLFHRTSAAFDLGGARGLLLNHVIVDDNCAIAFDSTAMHSTRHKSLPADSPPVDLSEISAMFNLERHAIASSQICPTFDSFSFVDGKEATSDDDGARRQSSVDYSDFNADFDVGSFGGGDDMNAFDNVDTYEDASGSRPNDDNDRFVAGSRTSSTSATGSTGPLFRSEGGEYGYFDPKALRNWAGPGHWRPYKSARQIMREKEAGAPSKKEKKQFRIDFTNVQEPDWEDDMLAGNPESIMLAKSTLQKHTATDLILPEDIHYTVAHLAALFSKPEWKAQIKPMGSQMRRSLCAGEAGTDEVPEASGSSFLPDAVQVIGGEGEILGDSVDGGLYGNDVENEPFDAGAADDDFDDDYGSHDTGGGFAGTNESMFQLIDEPTKVEKIHIGYATRAKQLDVRKVKKEMWKTFCEPSTASQEEEIDVGDEITVPQSFAEVVSSLPSKVPKKVAEELSIPLAFVCLLHLANEKDLQIEGTSGLDNLIVTQRC